MKQPLFLPASKTTLHSRILRNIPDDPAPHTSVCAVHAPTLVRPSLFISRKVRINKLMNAVISDNWGRVQNGVRRSTPPFYVLYFLLIFTQPDKYNTDEFDVLTKYLSLPSTPAELLNSASLRLPLLVRKWVDHPRVHTMLKPSAKPGVVTYPLKLNSLIPLPQDYSDLINSISGFTCPKVFQMQPT